MPIPRIRPSAIDDAGDAVRQVIRAYHGSPYDFDRFDASKIGTGEGAQTFGHGIYLAGNEDVGRYYRDSLSRRAVQTPDGEVPFPEWLSERMLRENGLDHYRTHWRDTLIPAEAAKGRDTSQLAADLRAMDALAAGGSMKSSGRMYEVEVGFPEHSLLDWDRPLRDQPQIAARMPDWAPALIDDGADGYKVYDWLKAWHGGPRKASQALLQEHGIPGIRYLDQGSRNAGGGGTRNYVIFPGAEDQIRILRKFAVPGVVGTGAAAMSGEE